MKFLIITILAIIALTLFSSTVLAAWEITPFDVIAPSQPTAPGTGDNTCVLYQTKGAYCSSYILVYQQCMPATTGTFWYQKQTDCRAMGKDYTCVSNECKYVQGSSNPGFCSSQYGSWVCQNPFIVVLGLILIGAIIWKKKK